MVNFVRCTDEFVAYISLYQLLLSFVFHLVMIYSVSTLHCVSKELPAYLMMVTL